MLDYLSQPVAFATAPLNVPMKKSRRDGGSGSDTDIEDPISRNISRGLNLIKATKSRILTRNDSKSVDSESTRAGPSKPSTLAPASAEIPDDWDDDGLEEECKLIASLSRSSILCNHFSIKMTTWQTLSASFDQTRSRRHP